MKVKELIAYLEKLDQDAICEYLECDDNGNGTWKDITEESLYYVDFRGNEFAKGQDFENKTFLQIGV